MPTIRTPAGRPKTLRVAVTWTTLTGFFFLTFWPGFAFFALIFTFDCLSLKVTSLPSLVVP